MRRITSISATFLTLPLLAFAQTPNTFKDVVQLIAGLLNGVIALAWAAIAVGFIYGVVRFLSNFDNEKEREEGKRFMVWSITAAAITLMIWGILNMLAGTFFGFGRIGIPLLTPPTGF